MGFRLRFSQQNQSIDCLYCRHKDIFGFLIILDDSWPASRPVSEICQSCGASSRRKNGSTHQFFGTPFRHLQLVEESSEATVNNLTFQASLMHGGTLSSPVTASPTDLWSSLSHAILCFSWFFSHGCEVKLRVACWVCWTFRPSTNCRVRSAAIEWAETLETTPCKAGSSGWPWELPILSMSCEESRDVKGCQGALKKSVPSGYDKIAIENTPFIVDFPIKNGDFP